MSPVRVHTVAERLREIRARLDASTPAPWRTSPTHYWAAGGVMHEVVLRPLGDGEVEFVAITGPIGETRAQQDAHFIAHAREDIAWLLGRVARLRAVQMRGWDTALDSAKHAHVVDEQNARLRAQIATLADEVDEVRAELDGIGHGGDQGDGYGVAPDEYDPADVVTARQLWQAIRGQLDPCDAWTSEEIHPLLRTFVSVLTRRRIETGPDGTPLRAALDRALEEDVSEYIHPAPNDFGGYDIERQALLDIVLAVAQPYVIPTGPARAAAVLAEGVRRAEQLGWRTVSVRKLAALAAGEIDALPALGGDGNG